MTDPPATAARPLGGGAAAGTTTAARTHTGRRCRIDFKRDVPWTVRLALGVAAWLLFLGGWQVAASAGIAPARLFPPPTQVFAALQTLFVEHGFAADVLASVQRIALSFGAAALFAVPLGLLMGAFPPVAAFFNPLVSPFRYLPAPAFIPLLLMWLGAGDGQKIALLFLGVVWFLVTLVMDVTRGVRMDLIETAKTLGATRRATLWTVVTPAALPGIVDTLRQMLAVSWTYLVIAEIVAATDGIGAMMMRAKRFVRVDDIMAGIVTIAVLGLLFDLAFRLLHWLLFPYLRARRD